MAPPIRKHKVAEAAKLSVKSPTDPIFLAGHTGIMAYECTHPVP